MQVQRRDPMDSRFIFSFSLGIGSLVMLVLNLVFFGNSFASLLLGASTALNFAVMGSLYPENTKEALKKIFWRD